MNTRPNVVPSEENESATEWEALDARVSTAVREIQTALGDALAATRDLAEWVERLHTLSAFMRQVELGLGEVRQQLNESPRGIRPVAVPPFVPEAEEPWPLEPTPAESEAGEERAAPVAEGGEPPEPAEGEPPDKAPSAAGEGGSVCLKIESTEANVDLMVVESVLRETPGVADVDLLDYAGKRAAVRVTLSEAARPGETDEPQRMAAHVQERLAELTGDGNLSVSVSE